MSHSPNGNCGAGICCVLISVIDLNRGCISARIDTRQIPVNSSTFTRDAAASY